MDIPGMPEIPTDNLYKFVALSGILMMLVGFAVPPLIRYRAMQADLALLAQYKAENARRSRALDQMSRAIDVLESANGQALEAARNFRAPDTSKREVDDPTKTADAIADSAKAVTDSLEQEDIESLDRSVEADREFFAFFVWLGWGLAFAGTLMAIWGFRNWYVKLQKPLDDIVRLDAEGRRSTIPR
jgi:hypothetical protein